MPFLVQPELGTCRWWKLNTFRPPPLACSVPTWIRSKVIRNGILTVLVRTVLTAGWLKVRVKILADRHS